jgi:hypothetical protein
MPIIVLHLPKTNTVKYSSKPLNGKDDITEVNPQEFAQQHQFEWHDDLLIEDDLVELYQAMKPTLPILASGYVICQELQPGEPIDESIITTENMPFLHDAILAQEEKAKVYLKEIEEIIPNLVVCEIDPRVGKGLFWRGPGNIKKGTAIACYSGIMGISQPNSFSCYGYSVPAHPLFKNHSIAATGIIEGLNGSLARFIQHFPDATQLPQHYKLDPTIQSKDIATANVEAINLIVEGVPLVVLVATEDITPNSQIGFDYSLSYWAMAYRHLQIAPLLFNKQSEILDPTKYARLILNINIGTETAALPIIDIMECILKDMRYEIINNRNSKEGVKLSSKELTALVIAELTKQNTAPNTILSHFQKWLVTIQQSENPTINYQEKFINAIYSILLKYWLMNTFDQSTAARIKIPYIEKILNAITDSLNADQVFLAVKQKMDYATDRDFYTKQLKEMRSEIISAMKTYNTEKLAIQNSLPSTTQISSFSQ